MDLLINRPNHKRPSIGAAVAFLTSCLLVRNREIKSSANVPKMEIDSEVLKLAVWIFMKILILNCFLMLSMLSRGRKAVET